MKSNLRKCAVIAAIVFLPEVLFAKGAVVSYAHGSIASTLTDTAQLDHLTHNGS